MAINIYDRPMQAEFMDTYTPMPYQEIMQAMNMKQQQHDKGVALEEDFQDTLFKVQALTQDKAERNTRQDMYENAISDKVANYGGEYARLIPFINEQRKKLHKDMTRGKFAAMEKSHGLGMKYLERMEKLLDKEKIPTDLKKFLEGKSFADYPGIGEMQADGSYNVFKGEDPAMLDKTMADQAMTAIKGWGIDERRLDYDKVYKRGPKTKENPEGQLILDANGQPQPVFYNFRQQRYVDDQEVYDSLFQSLASKPGNRLYTQQRAEMQSYGLEPEDLKMTTMEEGPNGKMIPTVSLAESPEEWENWKINKMFHNAIAPAANKAGFVQYKNKYVADWEAKLGWEDAFNVPLSPDITTQVGAFQFQGISGNSIKSLDDNRDGYQASIDNIIGDLDHLGKLNGIPRRDASTSDAAYFKALKGAPNIDIDLVKQKEAAYYLNKRKISISNQKEKEAQSWVDRNDPRMKATKDLYGHWNPYTLEGLAVDEEGTAQGFGNLVEYDYQRTHDGVPSKGIEDPNHFFHSDPKVAAFVETLDGRIPTLKEVIMGINPNATNDNWWKEAQRIKAAYDFRRSSLDEYIDATDYVVTDAITGYDLPGLGDSKEALKMKAQTREIVAALASDPSTWAEYPILNAKWDQDDQGTTLNALASGISNMKAPLRWKPDGKGKAANFFVDGDNIQLTRDQMPDGLRYWAISVTHENEAKKFLISEEAFNTPGMKQLQQTGLYRANEIYQAAHLEGLNGWPIRGAKDGVPELEGFEVVFRYTEDMHEATTDFTRGEVKKEVIIDGKVYPGNKGLEIIGSIIELHRAQEWTTEQIKEFIKDVK